MVAANLSPFLHAGNKSTADNLAIVHLKRDLLQPTILRERDDQDEGYDEGKVLNTRFGSFPHKTLIDVPWGSQVRASLVDTGSRGRQEKRKRKREESEAGSEQQEKKPVAASSGFIHLLPPTPETWTSSLPHRTQVVYTPDYSYILHRIRARPGTSLIEAGAGSGSFTHASSRAVYSGYPSSSIASDGKPSKKRKLGKVWSFEFHEQRHEKLVREIKDHRLEEIVDITHRDVCRDGFLVSGQSPNATAVFLDLPAPWLALPHLSRTNLHEKAKTDAKIAEIISHIAEPTEPFVPVVSPKSTIHICTFSPCIEQVQKTISVMRHLGWLDIEMVEVSHKNIEVRRERVGISKDNDRGVLATPATVEEAVARLKEVEGHFLKFHNGNISETTGEDRENGEESNPATPAVPPAKKEPRENPNSKAKILEALVERKIYKDGRLVHRAEPELKTHTSYLVFAVLPIEWTEEDEAKAREKFPVRLKEELTGVVNGNGTKRMRGKVDPNAPPSKRQLKKLEKAARESEVEVKMEAAPTATATGQVEPKVEHGAGEIEMTDAPA